MRLKQFQVGNHTINIQYKKVIKDHQNPKRDIFGRVNYVTNVIEIAETMSGFPISKDVQEHTLHHELVHYMLHLTGQWKLNQNETFVDLLGGFIAQFNKTKK